MNTKEYYYDSDRYVVSIDRGQNGFFERKGKDENNKWEFVIPGSLRWDALHQDIYFAHHDFDSCPKEIVNTLPELPPMATFKAMDWKDNFLPLEKMPINDFPFLVKQITENNGELCFWFVLNEDLYETFHGDGKFLYFHGEVYKSENKAISRIKKEEETSNIREKPYTGYMSIVMKKFRVAIGGEEIIPYDFYPEKYEDFAIEKIIERIEELLSSKDDDDWGKQDKNKLYIK